MKSVETTNKEARFSPLELSILHLLISGFNIARIAQELSMTSQEVIEICSIMMSKRKVENLKDLVYKELKNNHKY